MSTNASKASTKKTSRQELQIDPLALIIKMTESIKHLPADSEHIKGANALIQLLTVKEIAVLWNCSEIYVRKLITQSDGPKVTKLGSAIRIRYVDALAYLESHRGA